jgi:hypothetical protein
MYSPNQNPFYIKYEVNNDHSVPSTPPNYYAAAHHGLYHFNQAATATSPFEDPYFYSPTSVFTSNVGGGQHSDGACVNLENFAATPPKFEKKSNVKINDGNFEFSENLLNYESDLFAGEKAQNGRNKTSCEVVAADPAIDAKKRKSNKELVKSQQSRIKICNKNVTDINDNEGKVKFKRKISKKKYLKRNRERVNFAHIANK